MVIPLTPQSVISAVPPDASFLQRPHPVIPEWGYRESILTLGLRLTLGVVFIRVFRVHPWPGILTLRFAFDLGFSGRRGKGQGQSQDGFPITPSGMTVRW